MEMSDSSFCEKCGHRLDVDSNFCPKCGSIVSDISNEAQKKREHHTKKRGEVKSKNLL